MVNLIETLIRHEGKKNKPYRCTENYLTIGVGRNLETVGLSDDEIYYLLKNDITRCHDQLNSTFSWYKDLDPNRKDALINLCFNLGIGTLSKFKKALEAMEAKDYELAATEFLDSKWAKQVGQRAIEVTDDIRGYSHG